MSDWIACKDSLPCFICFGFPTGRSIFWKAADCSEGSGPYHGYGEFGNPPAVEVTHWRPSESDIHLIREHDAPGFHGRDTPEPRNG